MIHLVVGVSVENGPEGDLLYETPLNSFKFIQILNEFDRNGSDYTLFGDTATCHKSRDCFNA